METLTVILIVAATACFGLAVGTIFAFVFIAHAITVSNRGMVELVVSLVDAIVTPKEQQIARQDIKNPEPRRMEPRVEPVPFKHGIIADIPMTTGGMGPD